MKRNIYALTILVTIALTIAGAVGASGPEAALASINASDILTYIRRLASDEFEGRAPASKGEEMTLNYLVENFKKLGLKPGNPDGTYLQKVPLIGYTPEPQLSFIAGDKTVKLQYRDDFVASTRRLVEQVSIDGDLVFVGYGAAAPEFNWNDYKNEDLRGKVLVMLINDPPLPDEKMFGGRAMTYYGRWTYKYEIAAEKGAAGCLIVHETEPASYPWEVVRNSWGVKGFTIGGPDNNMSLAPFEGWITVEKAKELFALAGKDFAAAKQAALNRDFRPLPLGVKASMRLKNDFSRVDSHNVIAKLEGSDPKLKDEYVVYMAHWDHFGVGVPVNNDAIYNGAVDNATGTAGLLELAKAFTKLPKPPRRSILFLAVTGEERGLLGSAYYGENPLYPLTKTVAAINMDALNVYGRTKDVMVIGLGNSTLDDYVKAAASKQGRVAKPDPTPEKGSFYRSDHFSFAKQGVPALYAKSGVEFVDKPADYGAKINARYTAEDYHKPSDEVRSDWDLSGMVEDLQMLLRVGYEVAEADGIPSWREGTEFKAKREQMLKAAGNK
ncbi:MAG: M28 family metallopeptidase [Acidobacteriota bacterium]